MDEAVAVRRAALDAVADVAPDALRADLEGHIADGSLVPGILTLLTAREAGVTADLDDRAAGVQLIYDGLRLTRRLAHDEPWTYGEDDAANMDILAADVLVARGFHLLARTEAAAAAVEVVRAFGQDQTERRTADAPEELDDRLESDVLELALIAGVTAAGVDPDDPETAAAGLAADGFPSPEGLFTDAARERIAAVSGDTGRALNRND
ncbi:DUF7114 family protein [Natronomonas sp. EA1]|uniref:DUF7114 family protein n=1 Tax=Natronomonas sp. EA1 TaxID=3421655 RepID=UPI003EC0C1AB